MKADLDQIKPPLLASKLLEWYAGKAQIEDLQGDIDEVFYNDLEIKSLRKAKLDYVRQVLSLVFSYALRKRKRDKAFHPLYMTQNDLAMFNNYLKIALRSLARHKFFTIINVVGLAFGMSITILYIGFMTSLLRYDKFHENFENTYRVVSTVDQKTSVRQYASAPSTIADILKNDYAGIDHIVKLNDWISGDVEYSNKTLYMTGFYTQPEFFKIFSFNMLKGNPETALREPFQVIMTSSAAVKMFGDADPIGKVMTFGQKGDYTVSGIVADPPKGSHIVFEVLASFSSLAPLETEEKVGKLTNEWQAFGGNYTYMVLDEDETVGVQKTLDKLADQMYANSTQSTATFELQPMDEIVLGWINYNDDIGPYFGGPAIFGFAAITLLILLPACFNYSNISISRAMKRAKEIGIRKVVGGFKRQIWLQFIVETVIISLLALTGSIIIFFMIKDEFATMVAGGSTVNFEFDTAMLIAFIVFAIVTGVLAGIVPASYFSKIDPVVALKGSNMKLFGRTSFKKVLIVAQFTISLFFIIGVLVQLKQTRYSINYDLGFDKENILDVELQGVDQDIFRNEFSQLSSVTSLSMSSVIVGAHSPTWSWLYFTDRKDSINIGEISIDHNYIPNLDLTIIAGENFKQAAAHEEEFIIINEAFYKRMGLTNPLDALGKIFKLSDGKEVSILGVVKDFNYALLRAPISHFVFRNNPDQFRFANVKVNTTDNFNLLTDMENTWKGMEEEQKFNGRFFDDEIEEAFRTQSVIIKIYGVLGAFAIIVGCLGLLGMVVYSTETRAKEVGVRKVMGASVKDLVFLLSKEYLVLMLIAALIAMPASYFFFDFVLSVEQYYSVTVGISEMLLGLMILLVIGVLTLASRTIKTAIANPADTLQYE